MYRSCPLMKQNIIEIHRKNDFTIYRNIMNTATIRKAGSEVLGTLFIDISADYLKKDADTGKLWNKP